MAVVGFSNPKFARYSASGTDVSYSGGGSAGRGTSANIEIETSEDNNLYANNVIAETDRQFTGGTMTVGTDELSHQVSAAILGLKLQALPAIEGVTDEGVAELICDDTQNTPYLGFGFIRKHVYNGKTLWEGIVLTKVMFSVPSESATTQGETIEWQTPEITATIMRDDTPTHMWKRSATFTTEAQADAYTNYLLNIPSAEVGVGDLKVTSAAGTVPGQTVLTLSAVALTEQRYLYKVDASEITLPDTFGESLDGWTDWDGMSPITAAAGEYIAVAIANQAGGVVYAGQTTVVSNGG